jgi:membrane protein implicated in regulation of membrane protease activity
MKSGIKTTEFWLSILAIGLQVWMAVAGYIPADISAWIVALVTAVWVGFRTVAKITKSTKDDELIAKIEELLKKQAGQS